MPISKNLSDLRANGPTARTPDPAPRFGVLIAQAWHDQYLADGLDTRATAFPTPLRGSDAGNCARALGYKVRRRMAEIHNADPANETAQLVVDSYSNPPTLADSWRMGLGSMVHSIVEELLPVAFPDAQCEVTLRVNEPDISIHADALVTIPAREEERTSSDGVAIAVTPARKVLIEFKTINGFGYKRAVTSIDGPAEGPRDSAVLQGALAAEEVDADELVICYLSLELISPSIAERNRIDDMGRFVAEWTFPKEVYLPLAQAERKRMAAVVALVEQGKLAPRAIPAGDIPHGARITDPNKGTWELRDANGEQVLQIGKTWHCGYCWDRDRCLSDGAS